MSRSNLIDIAAEKRAETEKAFRLFDGFEENDDGTFTMPEWLAVDKGFV